MKYWQAEIIGGLIVIVAAIIFTKWRFDAVMASDIPDWVKYLLLRM